jgi:hypothetical protein
VVVYVCNPSTWEENEFEVSLGYLVRLKIVLKTSK